MLNTRLFPCLQIRLLGLCILLQIRIAESFLAKPASPSGLLVSHDDAHHCRQRLRESSSERNDCEDSDLRMPPKAVIFDLDGCLWRPEMYELAWYGKGAPFSPDGKGNMISAGGDKVHLLGDVRVILTNLYQQQQQAESGITVGISSRTDEPDWARELLKKFTLQDGAASLWSVFENGPIEISYESKRDHFIRISSRTGIPLEDMIFFDNERGNCVEVAKLGVTVAYVPDGVTNKVYQAALSNFPAPKGQVVNYDIY